MRLLSLNDAPDVMLLGIADAREWPVRTTADGETVGWVTDLLVDDEGRAHYAVVALSEPHNDILVPVDQLHADDEEEELWLPGLSARRLRGIPAYRGDPSEVTPSYARSVAHAYAAAHAAGRYDDRYRRDPEPATRDGAADAELEELEELEQYKIATGDVDPRGWSVIVGDGTRIGLVRRLVVDTRSLKVRYLVCAVDPAVSARAGVGRPGRGKGAWHVLIPTAFARLDPHGQRVIVDTIRAGDLDRLPEYGGLPLDPRDEDQVRGVFAGTPPVEVKRRPRRASGNRHFHTRRPRPPDGPARS